MRTRIRVMAFITWTRVEWSRDENAFRSRSLCNGRGISERGRTLRSRQNGARRRLQTLGRIFAVSDSRNGRSDGTRKILAERLGIVWRRLGFAHRRPGGIWAVLGTLPAHRSRKAVRLENGAGIFSDHVRDDRALL